MNADERKKLKRAVNRMLRIAQRRMEHFDNAVETMLDSTNVLLPVESDEGWTVGGVKEAVERDVRSKHPDVMVHRTWVLLLERYYEDKEPRLIIELGNRALALPYKTWDGPAFAKRCYKAAILLVKAKHDSAFTLPMSP